MRRLMLIGVIGFGACERGPVFMTADRAQQASSGRIEGNVVASGPARGNVVLFLFDAAKPPPPAGTGSPLTFNVVPAAKLFGSQPGNGPFSAPFSFSLVKTGNYLITGLIDTNADFIPWYGVTAGANAGDVGGAAVDPVSKVPQVISVDNAATLNVAVSFGTTVPIDRPAFQVASASQSATVSTMPVVLDLVPQRIDDGIVHELPAFFPFTLADTNMDGTPEVIWPRVIVRKTASCDDLLEDDHGDYAHVVGTKLVDKDGVPDVVVLVAGFDPTDLIGSTMPFAPKLRLVVRPVALDATNAAMPVPIMGVPSGCYAINLIAQTGQTWRVPNELAPSIAPAIGLTELPSQQFVIQVP